MKSEQIKKLTLTGLMCAIVVIATMFAAVPVPGVAGAYANAGDAAVYAAAYLLGAPWGVAAAAVGSGLADILIGSALYAPATFFIKGVMALIAAKTVRGKGGKWMLAVCGLVMTAGYFAYECLIYGAETAMISIPANLIQGIAGALLGSMAIRGIDSFKKMG